MSTCEFCKNVKQNKSLCDNCGELKFSSSANIICGTTMKPIYRGEIYLTSKYLIVRCITVKEESIGGAGAAFGLLGGIVAESAKKVAQQSVKASQRAVRLARETARRTAQGVKVAVKATVSAIKAIIAGTKALIAAIVAGGWVAVVVIIVVCLIALLCSSIFGIFFSSEDTGGTKTMNTVVNEINQEWR